MESDSNISIYRKGIEFDHLQDFKSGETSVQRVSFSESDRRLLIKYGSTYSVFRVSDIPESVNLDLSKGIDKPRDLYLAHTFANVLHVAMEAFVLACATMSDLTNVAQLHVRDFIYKVLCKMFATKVRHRDIVVVCDDSNNPPDSRMTVTVVFKPTVGIFSFCPITA